MSTLNNILLDSQRTKQSAHSNILIGKVVGVRNPVRDGRRLPTLWNVEYTSRRGVKSVFYDLRSAVPLRAEHGKPGDADFRKGHEVFFVLQDGDPLRGGFILGQTTDPIQWSARIDTLDRLKYVDTVWNVEGEEGQGASSTLFNGRLQPFPLRFDSERALIEAVSPAENPMSITGRPLYLDWLQNEPALKYVQLTAGYVIPSQRVALEVIVSKSDEKSWAFSHDVRKNKSTIAGFSTLPSYAMKVDLGYGIRRGADAPYVIEFDNVRNSEVFHYELQPTGLNQNFTTIDQQMEEVVDEHPLPGGVVKKSIATQVNTISTNWLSLYQTDSRHSFTTTFDFAGNVGRIVDLFVAVQIRSSDLNSFPAVIESTHDLQALDIIVKEIGIGSAIE